MFTLKTIEYFVFLSSNWAEVNVEFLGVLLETIGRMGVWIYCKKDIRPFPRCPGSSSLSPPHTQKVTGSIL